MQQYTNVLEVDSLSKKFRLKKSENVSVNTSEFSYALKDVSFSLKQGESLGIIGKNGSGKSTLLKILSGIVKPTSGTVKIYGTCASILDLGFGMVPEFTGRENIYFVGSLDGHTKANMKTLAEEIIDFSEISGAIDQPIKTYSNGMYLRLAFAIKTILQADLLILDEVMSVGDLKFQEKCRNKIRELQTKGKSIIIVSHNLKETVEYTKTCLLLNNGQIEAYDKTLKVVKGYETLLGFNLQKASPTINHAIDKDTRVVVLDYMLSSHRIKVMNESLLISITFIITKPGNYDLMVYVSDFNGILLSDSFSYRPQPIFKIDNTGQYTCECELPANFFNVGTYSVGFIISDRYISLFENLRCMSFDVVIDEFAAYTSPWSIHDKNYSLRPQLQWKMQNRAAE